MSVGKWNVEASVDIGSVKKATSELQNEMKKAGDEVEKNFGNKTKKTLGDLENKLESLKTQLKSVEIGSKSFKKIQESIKEVEGQIEKTKPKLGFFETTLGKIGGFLGFTTLAYGVGNFMTNVAKAGSQLESAHMSFETLLGSAEKAKEHLAYIDQIAQTSPFSKMGVIELNQQLLGFGFSSEMALTSTQVLGDAISAVGKGTEDLQGVALALGQIEAKGKLSSEEVMQMAERGLPVLQILKEELNLTEEQIGNLGNAGIDSATGINAILTGLNKRFAGSMQKQSQTLSGMWANMVDNAGIILGKIGANVGDSLKEVLGAIGDFLEQNMGAIIDFGTSVFSSFFNLGKSIFDAAFGIIGSILNAFGFVADTAGQKGTSLMSVFKTIFLFLSMGFQTVLLVVTTAVGTVFASIKSVGMGLGAAFSQVFNGAKIAVATVANGIIKSINGVINGINKFRKLLNLTAYDTIKEFDVTKEKAEVSDAFKSLGEDVKGEFAKVGEQSMGIIKNMTATLEGFNTKTEETAGNQKKIGDLVNNTLAGMSNSYGKMGNAGASAGDKAGGGSKKAAKESEEQKKKVEEVEQKYKDLKDEVKELDKKTEEYAKNHKKYYEDIVKDVEKLQKELKKAKTELEKELNEVEEDKNNDISDRYVEIKERELKIEEEIQEILDKAEMSDDKRAEELEKINKQIEIQKQRISEINDKTKESTKNSLKNKLEELEAQKKKLEDGEMSLEQAKKLAELEAESLRIAKEKELIEKNVSGERLADAERFNSLSKTEQILETSEKKKKKAEEEFEIEKKKIENMIKINEFFYKADTFNQKMYDEIQKSEFFKKLSDEEKELLNKLAKEKLELENRKNEIIKMQEQISEKTKQLSDETAEKQLQNNDKIKKSYDEIIKQIDRAIQKQIQLNSLKGGRGYKDGGFTGFSSGGFTGGNNKDKIAGVVHEGEWVAPKWMVDRLAPLFSSLEAQRLSGNTTNITKNQTNNITVGGTFEAKDFLDYAKWKL